MPLTRDVRHRNGNRKIPAPRDAMAKLTGAMRATKRNLDTLSDTQSNISDALGVMARKLGQVAEHRRAAVAAERDRAAAPGGIVSATSGYVRDASGARVRQMTTEDLARVHAEFYRRTA